MMKKISVIMLSLLLFCAVISIWIIVIAQFAGSIADKRERKQTDITLMEESTKDYILPLTKFSFPYGESDVLFNDKCLIIDKPDQTYMTIQHSKFEPEMINYLMKILLKWDEYYVIRFNEKYFVSINEMKWRVRYFEKDSMILITVNKDWNYGLSK